MQQAQHRGGQLLSSPQAIYHIHMNEMDGRHPGTGTYDFRTVLQPLKEISYSRWLSVEVFDFSLGGERIASEAAEFLRKQEAQLR